MGNYTIYHFLAIQSDTQFNACDYISGSVGSEVAGDRGDISAGWNYKTGIWTLEFGCRLTTGSTTDVHFEDLGDTCYFGILVFDDAQVRHAFETGAFFQIFKPKPSRIDP